MNLKTRHAALCAIYAVLHVASQLSARLFEIAPGISVWYLPCGLAFSLLLLLGPRAWWVVLATNIAGALLVPGFPRWWAPLVFPGLITANFTLLAWFVRKFCARPLLPGTWRGTLRFAALVALAPLPVALLGTLLIEVIAPLAGGAFWRSVASWWIGDMSGLLTALPIALVFVAPWVEGKSHPATRWRWEWRFVAHVAAIAVTLVASLWFAFAQNVPHGTFYVCFLPLTWASLRYGLPGATLATLGLILGTLIGMHHSPYNEAYWLSFILFELAVAVLGLGLGSAVTRRNEAQAELAESRARFDRVLAGAQLGLWDWNTGSGEVVYNERCAELLGCSMPDLASREAWDRAIHAVDRLRNEDALRAHLQGETGLYECEYRIRTLDGRWRWIQSRGSIVHRNADGSPQRVSGTHADVTERKLAEGAARRLLAIVESTTDFVLTIDVHGRVLYANTSLLQLLGFSDFSPLEGQTFLAVFPPGSAEMIQTDVIPGALSKGCWQGEITVADAQQRSIPTSFVALVHRGMEDEGSLLSFVLRNISSQKLAEAANLDRERRILQVQKSESLGVLAGGIAHDFNNLLTVIAGNAALIREDLPEAAAQAPLSQIEIAATRAAELCRNLLAYSGRARLTLGEVKLNQLVQESRELVHAAISRKIQLETQLAADLPNFSGCASQLQQIIINLALNANDAIGDRPGRICFRTFSRQLDSAAAMPFDGQALKPGRYVFLEVEDTGCGIADPIREKIFEPFFSTKEKGHGLGLCAVNGIVRAHSGAIRVRSEPGRGSTFQIALPAFETPAVLLKPPVPGTANWRGSGLALIVDDEEMVLKVIARLVERCGFETVTAHDGAEPSTSSRSISPASASS